MCDFELIPAGPSCPRIETVWKQLAEAAPSSSYFVSWNLVRTWLDNLPTGHNVHLLVGSRQGAPVLACLLRPSRFSRHGVFRGNALHLGAGGVAEDDLIYPEHNDVLIHGDEDPQVLLEGMFDFLGRQRQLRWDELCLPGLTEGSALLTYIEGVGPRGSTLVVESDTSSPYADLDAIRDQDVDYLSTLSANSRQQLRRSIRAYEAEGKLILDVAETPDMALDIFAELVDLHQRHWRARTAPGAFAQAQTIRFHRELIRAGLPDGQIQLLRLRCDDTTIGCLYSFISQRHVYFYQGGLSYSEDKKKRPGMVSHYYAICHSLERGLGVYDFLAGPTRYKMSLSSGTKRMVWCRLQRARFGLSLERRLRRLRSRWRGAQPQKAAG